MLRPSRPSRDDFDEVSSLALRLLIAILSSLLLGMTTSDALPGLDQFIAGSTAAFGMLFCCYRMLVIRRSHTTFLREIRRRTERRLDIFLQSTRSLNGHRSFVTCLAPRFPEPNRPWT